MREARAKPIRDHENENHIVNCGDYEISDGAQGAQLEHFIKTKLYKLEGNKSLGEISNFHLLRWSAIKVVKVVVCTRSPILLSLGFQK